MSGLLVMPPMEALLLSSISISAPTGRQAPVSGGRGVVFQDI